MRPLTLRRPLFALTLSLASTLALAGAVVSHPRVARAEVVDRVVAVIEDDAIFLSDLERRLRPFDRELEAMGNPRERAERRERLYRETLDRMIDDALIRRAAQRAHVSVADADVERMIEGIARSRHVTVQDIYDAVEHEGITRSEYRSFMEAQVLRLRVLNVRVRGRVHITDNDVAEEYRRRVRDATALSPFRAAHVYFAFPANPTAAQVAETRARAEQVAARAQAGEDFSVLAREFSQDEATRNDGGDLGPLDPRDTDAQIPSWLLAALRDLQPGQTTGAVRGDNGFHVFKLLSRDAPPPPPLAAVRDDLYQDLLNQEMTRQERVYLRELRHRTSIVVRL